MGGKYYFQIIVAKLLQLLIQKLPTRITTIAEMYLYFVNFPIIQNMVRAIDVIF